jgi:hypothetical protein
LPNNPTKRQGFWAGAISAQKAKILIGIVAFVLGIQSPAYSSHGVANECGKKSAVPVNRVDSTERVTPHDFSDDEAILVWLGLCLILCPLAYTLTERATVFFFGPDKDNNGG